MKNKMLDILELCLMPIIFCGLAIVPILIMSGFIFIVKWILGGYA